MGHFISGAVRVVCANRLAPCGPFLRRVGDIHPKAGGFLRLPVLLAGVILDALPQLPVSHADIARLIGNRGMPPIKCVSVFGCGNAVDGAALRQSDKGDGIQILLVPHFPVKHLLGKQVAHGSNGVQAFPDGSLKRKLKFHSLFLTFLASGSFAYSKVNNQDMGSE